MAIKNNFPEELKKKLFAEICQRIAHGETLNHIIKCGKPIIEGEVVPNRQTVINWTLKDKAMADEFHAAGLALLDYWRDEMVDIADDESRDQVPDGKGGFKSDNTAVNRDRLKVDTRKWIMCKLNPGKYGDKVEVGGNKEQPLTVNVKIV